MDYVLERLLREILKFLEMCQKKALKNEIDCESYLSLTKTKIDFISYVLKKEHESIVLTRDFRRRINNLYVNNSLITNRNAKVVGK